MMSDSVPVVVNGWTILAHPLLLEQIEALIAKVRALEAKDKGGFEQKGAPKRLKAIRKLMFEVVPRNPAAPEYRQGKTLGNEHTAWCRAKFFQQYRLFFRFHSQARVIVYALVRATAADKRASLEETRARLAALNKAHDNGIRLTLDEIEEAKRFASVVRLFG